MNFIVIAILAANLAGLYLLFDVSRLLRRILAQMGTSSAPSKDTFWRWGDDPRVSVEGGPHGNNAALRLTTHGDLRLTTHGDLRLTTRGDLSTFRLSVNCVDDASVAARQRARPVSGKVRYFAIWRWSGGLWAVEPGSVPEGCESGPPPNFKGEFEGQYVKTEVVRGLR